MTTWLVLAAMAMATSPTCVKRGDEDVQTALTRATPAAVEVLARLVYAEGLSTGFPDDPLLYRTIAWGTMNRVRLANRSVTLRGRFGDGVHGVVFQPGQFPPAVSTRSRFSRDFLCPDQPARWTLATAAANEAMGDGPNPLLQTDRERILGLSLVVNFYYPTSTQARGPHPPWEKDPSFQFIGAVQVGADTLSPDRVRFYRITDPPTDLGTGPL